VVRLVSDGAAAADVLDAVTARCLDMRVSLVFDAIASEWNIGCRRDVSGVIPQSPSGGPSQGSG
jgi:hypothetical protein